MELRGSTLFLALFVIAALQCSGEEADVSSALEQLSSPSSGPWQEVSALWQETVRARLRYLYYDEGTLQEYFNKYPILKGSDGWRLLTLDYQAIFPDKSGGLDVLAACSENVLKLAKNKANATKDKFLRQKITDTLAIFDDARSHSIQSRSANLKAADDDVNYGDIQNDAALDDDTQNDANADDDTQNDANADDDTQNDDGGDDEEEDVDAEITNKGEEFHVSIGKNVRLPCIIVPSPKENKGVVYQWLKDDSIYFLGRQKLSAPDRISVDKETENYLYIEDLQPEDSGKYRCMIMKERSHAAEKPDFIEHILRVEAAPRILEISATDRGLVHAGADLRITCNVSGSPPPKLIWSKETASGDSERLSEQTAEFAANSVVIRNIRPEQAGKYLCYADNKIGRPGFASINIKVLSKPRVHVHKAAVNADLNMEAILECSVHEHPPAHIRWYKDGSLLEDIARQFAVTTVDQHSTLKVIPTEARDFGVYTCEAENEFGKHNRSAELVRTPVIEDLETDGPKLSCRIISHQPLEQIQLKIIEIGGNGINKILQVPQPTPSPHEKHVYEIVYLIEDKDLNPGKYHAMVNAKNSVDWGRWTDPVVIEIDSQPLIQGASVYRGSARAVLPTTSLLATISMYLFYRML